MRNPDPLEEEMTNVPTQVAGLARSKQTMPALVNTVTDPALGRDCDLPALRAALAGSVYALPLPSRGMSLSLYR